MSMTTPRVITYLLIEDNDEHAEIIMKCFKYEKLASDVHHVRTGADCLAYLAGEKPFDNREWYPFPDIVLLDIRMPGALDGLQTLKAIRSDPKNASLSVIVLTSSESKQDIERAHQLGVNGYIVKSDKTDEMIEKIRDLQMSFEKGDRFPDPEDATNMASLNLSQAEFAFPSTTDRMRDNDRQDAFDMLVLTYKEDRKRVLELLKDLERTDINRFINLAERFSVEKRHLFAAGQDVDWSFLREIVMERLPRYTTPKKMAEIVVNISALLEKNQAAWQDKESWQLWQGFCQAYLNQTFDWSEEDLESEVAEPLPWTLRRSKALAISILIVLLVLLLGMIVREFF